MNSAQADWKKLFDAAIKVRDLAPWEWMEEFDVFGFRPHGCSTTAFVGTMGGSGDYMAAAVYPGPNEWHAFCSAMNAPGAEDDPGRIMDIYQVQAVFGQASDLEPADRKLFRQLGLSFPPRALRPYFRSYRPGFFPWLIESGEVQLLTHALELLLDIAPQVREDPDLLQFCTRPYSMPVMIQKAAAGPWELGEDVFPPVDETLQIQVPELLVEMIGRMDTNTDQIEVDVFPSFMRVGPSTKRPLNPYLLLIVEPQSRSVLGFDMLEVATTLEAMRAAFPEKLLQALAKSGIRPATISVRSPWIHASLDAICEELDISVRQATRLPALDAARRSFESSLQAGN